MAPEVNIMETKDIIQVVLSVGVVCIGLFMIYKFMNVLPPLLSGIAFVLLGAGQLVHRFMHE